MDTTGPRQRRIDGGEKLVTGGRVEMYAPGRVCAATDCMTVLSRYNPSTLCGRHQGWDRAAVTRRARGPRSDEDQATTVTAHAQGHDGWCATCHLWFHIWPSLDPEHEMECPTCRQPATTVIACGAEAAGRRGSESG